MFLVSISRRPFMRNAAGRLAVAALILSAAAVSAQEWTRFRGPGGRTHGNTAVHIDRVEAFMHSDRPLWQHHPEPETPEIARFGEIVAALVENRATLQMGIGAIPDAVLSRLGDKRDLGIHTEMFSDRLVDLVESGAITNRFKQVHPVRIVTLRAAEHRSGAPRRRGLLRLGPAAARGLRTGQRRNPNGPQTGKPRQSLRTSS